MKKAITQSELDEIEQFLTLDEEDLYGLIPVYLRDYTLERAFHSPSLDDSSETEKGKKIFQSVRDPIHEKLCQDWNLCEKIDDPNLGDQMNLVVTLADIISPMVIGLPPFLISSILIKMGLRKFCNCSQRKD
ncbi:MAG: hypothetical protein AAGF93_01420 [Cyanobacteria bacterium P01_H01_bin.105]